MRRAEQVDCGCPGHFPAQDHATDAFERGKSLRFQRENAGGVGKSASPVGATVESTAAHRSIERINIPLLCGWTIYRPFAVLESNTRLPLHAHRHVIALDQPHLWPARATSAVARHGFTVFFRMSVMTEQTLVAPIDDQPQLASGFSGYQSALVALLAFVQFTIILDFMIMSPLGAIIMPALNITAAQFGVAVSAYAFSAGISGILAAGFADRFDRKRLLLFFYVGFALGTVLCSLAPTFHLLLLGRIVTGLFGGVMGSVILAIVIDLFALHLRGRVMGFVQTAFAASQVLGIPAGLYLSNHWNWHVTFGALVGLSIAGMAAVLLLMKPVNGHLLLKQDTNAFRHLIATVGQPRYTLAFAVTTLLATGGFMLMPFGSAYTVNNLGIDIAHLPTIYLVSGLFSIFTGPLVGRASDAFGKFPTFAFGSFVSIVMVLIYTRLDYLGHVTLTTVIVVNVLMFVGIFSRMIPSQALISAIPESSQRGSFSAVSASLQQLSGGLGSVLAAAIIAQNADGTLRHFDRLGYIVVATSLASLTLMYFVQKSVANRAGKRFV
jgi:predicted MFS family arabinose efflux permease